MAILKTQPPGTGSGTKSQQIQTQIISKSRQLNIWQSELDNLLNSAKSDIGEIRTLMDLVENLNKEVLRFKTELRKLGLEFDESSEISSDNQTRISTGSVRRKDPKALKFVSIPVSSTTLNTTITP